LQKKLRKKLRTNSMIQRTLILRMLPVGLALALLCASGRAEPGAPAPQFSLQTLDGARFSSASLRGKVTLVQFWATWCPHCRADQPAVDQVARTFAGQGLVVLAVDVGESEEAVAKYLRQHPRACRIAMDENKNLSARFGVSGYPYYVAIDRAGRIAGTQEGEGGEQSLLDLLSRAGLAAPFSAPQSAPLDRQQARGESSGPLLHSGGAMVIDVPQDDVPQDDVRQDDVRQDVPKEATSAPRRNRKQARERAKEIAPAKPLPKTVFVLASGERLESDHYELDAKFLHLAVGEQQRTIALNALDLPATNAANRARGVDLKIPNNRNEVFVGF
jgi:thiol-disulfide isomerase/thioredoxin